MDNTFIEKTEEKDSKYWNNNFWFKINNEIIQILIWPERTVDPSCKRDFSSFCSDTLQEVLRYIRDFPGIKGLLQIPNTSSQEIPRNSGGNYKGEGLEKKNASLMDSLDEMTKNSSSSVY